jgi:hypothetical protein
MQKNKPVQKTIQELKKEKSKTNWARILAEKEAPSKNTQIVEKTN